MSGLRGVTLTARFLCELAMLAAIGVPLGLASVLSISGGIAATSVEP